MKLARQSTPMAIGPYNEARSLMPSIAH